MKLLYLAGDIMGKGSQLARKEEYDQVNALNLPLEVYSPVLNASINDKTSVTVEENNTLAERICDADMERMWTADSVVISPEQHAIGTLCELGCLFGWQYMAERLLELPAEEREAELKRIASKETFVHYYDLRDTEIPEIGWRRSFSINQLLYGMILKLSGGIESFSDIIDHLREKYSK